MGTQAGKATQEQILQFMTTEHFTLQTARSATIAEANGRSALYLGSVSSAVVALAFVGQVSDMGGAFFLFGIVLFPSLFFLGIVTFDRVLQTSLEDIIHAREINRIRHYYIELAPEIGRYFLHSTHDDEAGSFQNMGIVPSKWQPFLTTAGMVAVINSVIAGVFAAMALKFALSLTNYACAGLGVPVFVVSVVLHRHFGLKKSTQVTSKLETLFPSRSK